jgi:hypothetical protein
VSRAREGALSSFKIGTIRLSAGLKFLSMELQ